MSLQIFSSVLGYNTKLFPAKNSTDDDFLCMRILDMNYSSNNFIYLRLFNKFLFHAEI